jgi:hypothetical protein
MGHMLGTVQYAPARLGSKEFCQPGGKVGFRDCVPSLSCEGVNGLRGTGEKVTDRDPSRVIGTMFGFDFLCGLGIH